MIRNAIASGQLAGGHNHSALSSSNPAAADPEKESEEQMARFTEYWKEQLGWDED